VDLAAAPVDHLQLEALAEPVEQVKQEALKDQSRK
jgi:hypothetical protein